MAVVGCRRCRGKEPGWQERGGDRGRWRERRGRGERQGCSGEEDEDEEGG